LYLSNGDIIVVNNVVSDNGTSTAAVGGVKLAPGSGKVTFVNNTIADNSSTTKQTYNIVCVSVSSSITNSILWSKFLYSTEKGHQGCTFANSDVQGITAGSGNINTNPLFDTDYSILTVSPCVDKGTSTTATVVDILGKTRPMGTGVDMGAYEVK
jgi:hypothetical protein